MVKPRSVLPTGAFLFCFSRTKGAIRLTEHQLIAEIGKVKLLTTEKRADHDIPLLPVNTIATLSLYGNNGRGQKLRHIILRDDFGSALISEDGMLSVDGSIITFTGAETVYKFCRINRAQKKDPEEGRSKWKCLHCGKDNSVGSAYCEICRTPRKNHEVTCKYCHSTISVTNRLCPECSLGTRHSIVMDWLNLNDRSIKIAKRNTKRIGIFAMCNTVILAVEAILFLVTYRISHGLTPVSSGIVLLHSILIGMIPLLTVSEVIFLRLYRRRKTELINLIEQRLFEEADTDDFVPYYLIHNHGKGATNGNSQT